MPRGESFLDERRAGGDALALLDRDRLAGVSAGIDVLGRAVRPLHIDFRHLRRAAEAEGERQLALRHVAGSGAHHHPRRRAVRAGDARERADRVAIALRAADELHAQVLVLLAAVVAQYARRTVVVADHDVEIAVAVEIAVRGPARDHLLLQRRAGRRGHFLELL